MEISDATIDAPTIDAPIIDAPIIDFPIINAPIINAPINSAPINSAPIIDAFLLSQEITEDGKFYFNISLFSETFPFHYGGSSRVRMARTFKWFER